MTSMDFQASRAITVSLFDPHQHGLKTQCVTFEVSGGLQMSLHVQDTESVQFGQTVPVVIRRKRIATTSQDEHSEFCRSLT